MTPENWEQVDRLLQAALELDASERSAFLDQACAEDKDLRREVESLLAVNLPTNDFLSQPVVNFQDAALSVTTPERSEQSNGILEYGMILDDRYRVERELGRGGMGVVYLAQDQKLHNKQVVIKVLLVDFPASNESSQLSVGAWLKQKFRDEIKALSRIDHPGVIHALDMGELPEGQTYLVMNYVPGKSLRTAVSPNGMELWRASNLIHQIAQALSAAHKENVIHRDLKPENILLLDVDGEEQIRLIDFGIAAVRDAMSSSLPHTTHIAGTPAYMAPEQLAGQTVAASDIYALGVIAYELVTGKRPFNAASLTHLGDLQRAGIQVKPRQLRADLPEAAEAVILKALEFDPANRHPNAREFGNQFRQSVEAIDPFQTNIAALPAAQSYADAKSTQGFPSRRRFWIPETMLALLLLGALTWLWLYFGPGSSGNIQPVNPPVTLPIMPERTVSYSLWLKRAGRSRDVQPVLPRDVIGGAKDEFRINVSSPQAGFLYLFNERPTQPSKFDVMFPTGGSAEMRAAHVQQIPPPSGQPENDWFGFEREGANDIIWLIWSADKVPELEEVLKDGKIWAKPAGEIKSPEHVEAARRYLAKHAANAPTIETDETTKQTKLTGKGSVLIGLITLKHR